MAADGQDPPLADAAAAASGDDDAAAADALLSPASEQLTLLYQGEVYVFDPVPPQKVAPSAPFASNFFPIAFAEPAVLTLPALDGAAGSELRRGNIRLL
ncbi:hypothetical protein CFC21_060626, partial [Triticum aestivum]